MDNQIKVTETLQKYYDKVFQDGKLVNIHIGMWGMSYNLVEEDIKLENKLPETIKLGKKMLIKPAVYNKFKSKEQSIRKYLYANSFSFPLVAQAHFVPKNKFTDVYNKLVEMREEYMKMVDEFVEKYEDYKAEVVAYYKEHQATVDISDIEGYYPSKEAVRAKFYFDIVSFEISLPTEFKELNLQTEIAREEAAGEAKKQAQDVYSREYRRQLDTHMQKVNDFVNDVTTTLRTNVAEHCRIVLGKIKKKEIASESNIKTLLKHIDDFKSMNFINDTVIEEQLGKVQALLTSGSDFEKDKDAIQLLQTHLKAVVKEAENLTDVANISGEYFRKLSV
jgi:hypothetical protein